MILRASIVGLIIMISSWTKAEVLTPMMDDTISIDIITSLNATGDSVCADLVVTNFDSLLNIQFSIRFDPNVLALDCDYETEFNGTTPLIDPNFLVVNCVEGNDFVSLFWNYPLADLEGVTVADGTTILRFCFAIIGDPCATSPIFISSNPTFIEIVKKDGTALTDGDGLVFTSDSVQVSSSVLGIIDRHCNATTGNADGSITFYPCGGVGPYSWKFEGVDQGFLDNAEETTIPDLPFGQYDIMITDANGNSTMETIIVDEGVDAIDFDLIPTDPTCFTRENGRLKVENISGGFSPYEIEWSNFQFDTDEIRRLPSGEYSVTITDFLGCSFTKTETLFVDTLFGSVEIKDSAQCDGAFGTIAIRASGGNPFDPDRYRYNNLFVPVDTVCISVPSGMDVASIEDESGCRIEIEYNMPNKGGVTIDVSTDSVSCYGSADGIITAVPNGDISYRWELRYLDSTLTSFQGGQNQSGYFNPSVEIFSASNQDTFVLTATGITNNCSVMDTFIIHQPDTLIALANVSQPTCNGDDGTISLDITGGTPPYQIVWSDNNMDQNRINLGGGIYSATITDEKGCQDSIRTELQDGGMLVVNVFASQAIECGGSSNGSVTAEPQMAGNYTYAWSTSVGGMVISNNQTATNLGAGSYYVTITNTDLNCTVEDSTILIEPGDIQIQVDSIAPTCAAFANGRLGIIVVNGVSPFMYEWADDPDMDPNKSVLTSIGAGSYAVTITDDAGCTLDTILDLGAPAPIIVDVSNLIGLDCFGDVTGEATASASGGNPIGGDYTFLWSSGTVSNGTTHTATDLAAGTQWVLVGDGSCPSDTSFFEIADAAMIVLASSTVVSSPVCHDDCNASISAVAEGGNDPYSFVWQDGPNGPNRNNLCPGEYIVEITDFDGCTQTDTIIILNPDTLVAEINALSTVELTCDDDPGQIGVAVIGGVDGGYSYSWNNSPSTEAIAPDLQEGSYTVTVMDNAGCTDEATYTLTKPEDLVATLSDVLMPECFGERTCFTVEDASGGLGNNYTFSVNLGPLVPLDTCVDLFAGEYLINVFDSSGRCNIDTLITIDQPNPVVVDAGPDIEIDLGQATDPINLNINADNSINSITWSPFQFIDCITSDCQIVTAMPDQDMPFMISVVDNQGCVGTDELMIRVNTTRRVVFPNIFSPNDDAFNDRFQIGIGNGVELVNFLKIYDRWGNLMYQEDNFLPVSIDIGGWDGTYNGNKVGSGVYVVIAQVTFTDLKVINYQKSLTLVR